MRTCTHILACYSVMLALFIPVCQYRISISKNLAMLKHVHFKHDDFFQITHTQLHIPTYTWSSQMYWKCKT